MSVLLSMSWCDCNVLRLWWQVSSNGWLDNGERKFLFTPFDITDLENCLNELGI